MRRSGWLLSAVLVYSLASVSATAATRAYFVEPQTAANGWTDPDPNAYVGQTFVANVDSIRYIEWFVGELCPGGDYVFDVVDGGYRGHNT